MLDIEQLLKDAILENDLLCESGPRRRVPHVFEDETLTFGDIRDMFKQVFSGNSTLVEKIDGLNVGITYKDGGYRFATNKQTLQNPMDYSRLGARFEGSQCLKEAFVKSAQDLEKALRSLGSEIRDRVFGNGRNFLNVTIVYPPARNVMDYGNKCLLQLNGLDVYDENFNKVSEDDEMAKDLFQYLKVNNALKQEMFEIEQPNVLRIKDSVDAEKACQYLLTDLEQLADGIGYKATIQDYANDRLRKYVLNSAMKNGIDLGTNSQFVAEMANRLNVMSHRRPTKTDLVYCAKKDGINPRSKEYADLFNYLSENADSINEQIMRPVEALVVKASNLLFKNVMGFMAADPNANTRRIVDEIDKTTKMLESDDQGLTPSRMRMFRKHLGKIQEYQNEHNFPTEGVMFKYTTKDGRSKVYKMIGNFGAVNQLMNLLRK